ncbi:LysR family transcriptional regulator [Nocardioides sp.]|uniref:LysR family transcriptional regulator n=1 Tax=Nocardioides sp. TaxID=35761 RepID=UPI002ED1C234
MDRRHLEYFLAVAEQGSFTRAAATLSIAQPSLSHAIALLERDLGSQLFDRNGRGSRLTPEGEALLEPARQALRSFQVARGAVRAVSEGGFGQLSIITNTLWAVDPLSLMIGRFRALHPHVQVTVADPGRRSEVLEIVRSGGAELGLVDGEPPAGLLRSKWLMEQELVAVLPARSDPVGPTMTIADLVPFGLVSTPEGTALRTMVDERLEAAGRPGEVAVETAHLASVVPMVLAGAGAALLPQGLAADAAVKGARLLRLDPPARASVHLLWREGRLSALARQFVDVATGGPTDGGR